MSLATMLLASTLLASGAQAEEEQTSDEVVIELTFEAEDGAATQPEEAPNPWGKLFLEPRIGWFMPTNRMSSTPSYGVQGGFAAWPDKALWLVAELSFARPTVSGSARSRDGGPPLQYDIATSDMGLFLGARKVFRAPFGKKLPALEPFVDAGLQIHWLSTRLEGSAALGKSLESDFAVGAAARGGALYWLGPGAVTASLEASYVRFDQEITGGKSLAGFTPRVGYLVSF